MQKRLNSDFLGSAEICADKRLMEIFHDKHENDNNAKLAKARQVLLEVVRNDISARQKEYIMLYYYKQISMAEIAEMYNVNKSTVSRTLSRARQNIMQKLKYIL